MQNGALQGYPLDEDDLENFYIRNLSRFAVVTLGFQGLPWAPKEIPGAPKGLPRAPWGGVGAPRGSKGLYLMVIIPFTVTLNLLFLTYKLKQFPVKVGGF